MQVAPQLQVIVCGEEPLQLHRVNTAEVQLPLLPADATLHLLCAAAPKVNAVHSDPWSIPHSPLFMPQLHPQKLQTAQVARVTGGLTLHTVLSTGLYTI